MLYTGFLFLLHISFNFVHKFEYLISICANEAGAECILNLFLKIRQNNSNVRLRFCWFGSAVQIISRWLVFFVLFFFGRRRLGRKVNISLTDRFDNDLCGTVLSLLC